MADDLRAVLEEGQRRGLVGPGPLEAHITHALGFAAAARWPDPNAGEADNLPLSVDLGSGGGLPGLVLAVSFPASRWVLLDSRARSGEFLTEAVAQLGVEARVSVHLARAEEAGRDSLHRGAYGLVVARGFGPPAVTAECAAPLLAVGGVLVVSEPPEREGERWPPVPLAELGLRLSNTRGFGSAHYAVLEQVTPCPERYPRRTGMPAKRPLFAVPVPDRFT